MNAFSYRCVKFLSIVKQPFFGNAFCRQSDNIVIGSVLHAIKPATENMHSANHFIFD